MDRALDADYVRRQSTRRLAGSGGLVLGLAVLVGGVPRFIRPTLDRSEIRTAKVETGPVEATINATGTVVPEFEHVVSSPIDARVLRVLRKPGASLKPGEPILDLDVSESRLAYEKLVERVALKRNEEKQKRLGLARTLAANLDVLLPQSRVIRAPWPAAARPRCRVRVDLQRFGPQASTEVVLEGRYALLPADGERPLVARAVSLKRGPLGAATQGQDATAGVEAMSELVAYLAREIAAAIRALPAGTDESG